MTDESRMTDLDDPDQVRHLRERQRARATVLALVLAGLCVLFFLITIVKIGVAG